MYKITLDKEDFIRYQLFTASKSNRIKKKRIRVWLTLTISFFLLAFVVRETDDTFLSNYFIVFSILTLLFYPLYQRIQYRKHYEKHIEDNYQNRIGMESEIGFKNGFIVSIADHQEGKIKITEIKEINEISDNLFIKINTGESFIIPSRMAKYDKLKAQLTEIVEPLGVSWNKQLDWKWK